MDLEQRTHSPNTATQRRRYKVKFKKKPVVIDAVQYFPGVKIDGLHIVRGEQGVDYGSGVLGEQVLIKTLESNTFVVSKGDWIITGVKGEKYACKPDIFELTYDPVVEP